MSIPAREMLRIHLHFENGFEGATAWLPPLLVGPGAFGGAEEVLQASGDLARLLRVFRVDACLFGGPGMSFHPLAEIRRISPDELVDFVAGRFRGESEFRARLRAGGPIPPQAETFRRRLTDMMVLSTVTPRSMAPELLDRFRRSGGIPRQALPSAGARW